MDTTQPPRVVLSEVWQIRRVPYVSRFRFVAFDGPPDAEQLDALWRDFAEGLPSVRSP